MDIWRVTSCLFTYLLNCFVQSSTINDQDWTGKMSDSVIKYYMLEAKLGLTVTRVGSETSHQQLAVLALD
jgi:hypothetical protein